MTMSPTLGNDKFIMPRVSNVGDGLRKGEPTTPLLATGNVIGTTIDEMNNKLAHACDFVLELKKNIGLKKFIKAIAKWVREGIRAIMRYLGISDASGTMSAIINKLKALAEEIRYIQKEYIQPVLDFQKYVLAVITKIRAIIQWILSLPARLLALLQQCLKNLITALSSIFYDALKEAASEVPLGNQGSSFNELTDAAKDVLNASKDLLNSALQVGTNTAQIAASVSVGLLLPVSRSDLAAADAYILEYEKKLPSTDDSSNPVPDNSTIKKSP